MGFWRNVPSQLRGTRIHSPVLPFRSLRPIFWVWYTVCRAAYSFDSNYSYFVDITRHTKNIREHISSQTFIRVPCELGPVARIPFRLKCKNTNVALGGLSLPGLNIVRCAAVRFSYSLVWWKCNARSSFPEQASLRHHLPSHAPW